MFGIAFETLLLGVAFEAAYWAFYACIFYLFVALVAYAVAFCAVNYPMLLFITFNTCIFARTSNTMLNSFSTLYTNSTIFIILTLTDTSMVMKNAMLTCITLRACISISTQNTGDYCISTLFALTIIIIISGITLAFPGGLVFEKMGKSIALDAIICF